MTVHHPRVLLISQDIVGDTMAGPGIRYYHLARTLARHVDVVLAVPHESSSAVNSPGFAVVRYIRQDWTSLEGQISSAEIIVCPSDIASDFPQIAQGDACLVIDGYDPLLAEWLALSSRADLETQAVRWLQRMRELNRQYVVGDYFICSSERQRDWWLGLLEAHGRINPWTFADDPSLRRLIDVVAFGLPETPPQHTRPVIKGIVPGIDQQDSVILWGGGLWPWLDPLTAIQAVAEVWQTRQDVRLVLPDTAHPNPWMEEMPTLLESARSAAGDTGLLNKAIFFTPWLPYRDWTNALLESDIALALGHDTLETRLAFRSRVLEYIWAGLPVISTRGDATSDLIQEYGLGAVVDYEDTHAVAEAMIRLLEAPRSARAAPFDRVRKQLTWDRVAQPLIDFCLHPHHAPDRDFLGKDRDNPFCREETRRLMRERDHWRSLVRGYEQGRFIRLMKTLDRAKRSWRGADRQPHLPRG
jgi:glycosyltransferase involved in cell wall biosynthesis